MTDTTPAPPIAPPITTESTISSGGSVKIDIAKLTGQSNYITWHANMITYLDYLDVLEVVNGTDRAPDRLQLAEFKAWKKLDKTAKLAIQMSVSDE